MPQTFMQKEVAAITKLRQKHKKLPQRTLARNIADGLKGFTVRGVNVNFRPFASTYNTIRRIDGSIA